MFFCDKIGILQLDICLFVAFCDHIYVVSCFETIEKCQISPDKKYSNNKRELNT